MRLALSDRVDSDCLRFDEFDYLPFQFPIIQAVRINALVVCNSPKLDIAEQTGDVDM